MGVAYGVNPTWAAQTDAGRIHIATKGVVQSGLALNLDAGASTSYPGSGTTWTDLSGNGRNGTLVSSPTFSSANGGYLNFSGGSGASTPSLTLGSSDWTFECFLYLSSAVTQAGLFSYFLSDTGSRSISMSVSSNTFGWQHRLSTGSYISASGSITLSTQTWYQVVLVRSGKDYFTYINGVLDSSYTLASAGHTYYVDNVPYYIAYNRIGVNDLNGRISNLRFYINKGLTAQEIQQNFNALRGRFGI